jgi:hypothetical protein
MIGGYSYSAALPDDASATNCINAALDWMRKHQFRPTNSERKVYSRQYDFAGTLDWTAHITACGNPECCPFSGTLYVLGDFKSSKRIYDEYFIQTAAYKHAQEEEFPSQPIEGRVLLRLGKTDGAFDAHFRPNDTYEEDFEAFLGAMDVYNWLEKIRLDKKYDTQVRRAAKAAAQAAKPKRARRRKVVLKEAPVDDGFVITDMVA